MKAARAQVADIAQRYLGARPRRVLECGGGLTNTVYEVRVAGEDYIVRLNAEAAKIHDYQKEQWAMAQARAAGVPVPEVLEVGNEVGGLPYMISRKVVGVEATHHPERARLVAEMGRLAARLHGVRTRGFGPVFEWSSNRLSQCAAWKDFLDGPYDAAGRVALLERHRMLKPAQVKALRAALSQMRGWRRPPVLQHGDLRLKNLIVSPDGAQVVALIDWDQCLSAPAPHWELSIALHDLGVDEKEAFLCAYGLTPRALAVAMPCVRALNTLNYAAAVKAMVADKKQRARVELTRARLQGDFDLYV